jgi:hypothetical protein
MRCIFREYPQVFSVVFSYALVRRGVFWFDDYPPDIYLVYSNRSDLVDLLGYKSCFDCIQCSEYDR